MNVTVSIPLSHHSASLAALWASKATPPGDPAEDHVEVPEVKGDHAAAQEAERAKTALENVRQGYEKAPPGAAGEPSWPTGGNASEGPRGPRH